MEKFVVYSAIKTPDGTLLESVHRHDYKSHKDEITGEEYIIDGDLRTSINDVPGEYIVVYSTDDFEIVRKHLKIGTFDGNGERVYKTMCDCSNENVENIVEYLKNAIVPSSLSIVMK